MTGPSTMEHVTTASAWGAVASPVWLPTLREAGETAGLLLPILGATWLVTQIVAKLYTTFRKDK